VPEHDPTVLDLEDRRRLAAGPVAAVLRPLLEVEDGQHLALAFHLEVADAPAARQGCVPLHGFGMRGEDRFAVLDHPRAVCEQPRGLLVVVAVERGAPCAHDVRRRRRFGGATSGQREHTEQGRQNPHPGSLPPVDFELTPEQREIQALAKDFAAAEIEPHASDWDRAHAFPHELLGKLGALGLMGVCVPEEYGGAGADFLSYILVIEELSRADAGVGVTVAVHTSACSLPILQFGTEEQRARFVPPLARAEAVGCFALTEPGSGSDAGSIVTSAVEADGGWTISGAKQWITNAAFGGTILFFARTGTELRTARGISAFLVDTDQVTITRTEEKLGLNSSVTNDIAIDARVDADRLIGELHHGFRIAMATLDGGRIGIAAQAVGIAQAAYEVALQYSKEREAFGHKISEFQAIQHKLANMSMEIDAARLLVHKAAWLKDQGKPHTEAGAKAKLFASEMARRQTAEAIQVLGGYGYTKEFPVERYYRDAKITEIYEGTSEIQRLVIARSILRDTAGVRHAPKTPKEV
jgi:alkylation response protein AidB-like acyl-CoA dehydrogenase